MSWHLLSHILGSATKPFALCAHPTPRTRDAARSRCARAAARPRCRASCSCRGRWPKLAVMLQLAAVARLNRAVGDTLWIASAWTMRVWRRRFARSAPVLCARARRSRAAAHELCRLLLLPAAPRRRPYCCRQCRCVGGRTLSSWIAVCASGGATQMCSRIARDFARARRSCQRSRSCARASAVQPHPAAAAGDLYRQLPIVAAPSSGSPAGRDHRAMMAVMLPAGGSAARHPAPARGGAA